MSAMIHLPSPDTPADAEIALVRSAPVSGHPRRLIGACFAGLREAGHRVESSARV